MLMIDIDPKVDYIYSWGICYSSRKTKNVIVKSRLAEQFFKTILLLFFYLQWWVSCERFLEFEVNKYINT